MGRGSAVIPRIAVLGALSVVLVHRPAMGQTHDPLVYHGGPVLGQFTVYPLFYGQGWTSARQQAVYAEIQGFCFYMSGGQNPLYEQPLTKQYGVASASVASPVWVSQSTAPFVMSDTDVRNAIHAAQAQSPPAAPAYDLHTVILLLPGPGFSTGGSSYHSYESQQAFYSVVPYDQDGGTIGVINHELMEAATDPALNAWYGDVAGDEMADNCGNPDMDYFYFAGSPICLGGADNTRGGHCANSGGWLPWLPRPPQYHRTSIRQSKFPRSYVW